MKPQNKIKLLIIFCLLTLGGLVSIQYYLIQNTYHLTSKTYVNTVKKQIVPVIESPEVNSIESNFFEVFKKLCHQKATYQISSDEFKESARLLTDSIQQLSREYLKSKATDYPVLKDIRLRSQLTQIIFETNGVYDTLLKVTDDPLVYFGEPIEGNIFNINTSVIQSSIDKESDSISKTINYFYKHNESTDMDISNFSRNILKKMLWMLIAAIGLIFTVILLFFYMYRALIKQKKIAEIKTDFADNISHELKTPLTSLNLITKSIKKENTFQGSESAKQMVAVLERQITRMQTIVESVMESTIETKKIQMSEMDIIPFLKNIVADFNTATHQLESNIHPDTCVLKTDSYLLESTLHNLLDNAVKYSPNANKIFLKSYAKNNFYFIEITDYGNGIATSEQKNIFDKFYRITQGNRHDTKGLGLGLYLCKQMVTSLKGNIYVKSSLKKGSTFIIKIPV